MYVSAGLKLLFFRGLDSGRRSVPDEEGTETDKLLAAFGVPASVEEAFPTRRELKPDQAAPAIGKVDTVEEAFPTRRELKPCRGTAQTKRVAVEEAFPTRRELKRNSSAMGNND